MLNQTTGHALEHVGKLTTNSNSVMASIISLIPGSSRYRSWPAMSARKITVHAPCSNVCIHFLSRSMESLMEQTVTTVNHLRVSTISSIVLEIGQA